jgi:hypothetical protein
VQELVQESEEIRDKMVQRERRILEVAVAGAGPKLQRRPIRRGLVELVQSEGLK